MKYYEVIINKTSKQVTGVPRAEQGYQSWDRSVEKCSTLEEVKECLQGGNGYNVDYREWSKSKMYRDEVDNGSIHTGYVYASKGHEYDRNAGKLFYYYRDWVEVREISAETVVIKEIK